MSNIWRLRHLISYEWIDTQALGHKPNTCILRQHSWSRYEWRTMMFGRLRVKFNRINQNWARRLSSISNNLLSSALAQQKARLSIVDAALVLLVSLVLLVLLRREATYVTRLNVSDKGCVCGLAANYVLAVYCFQCCCRHVTKAMQYVS